MSKYAAILCASWDPSSPPWRGREGRTGRGSGSAGAGGCSSWAQEDGSAHHHFQEGFVAAGAKGKLRCAFKPEVFQVQIRSVSRRSPGQHFAIAVGTCCEMEENFEIAFAVQGYGWAGGRDAVGAGSRPWSTAGCSQGYGASRLGLPGLGR